MNKKIFIFFLIGILLVGGCVNQEPEIKDVGEKMREYQRLLQEKKSKSYDTFEAERFANEARKTLEQGERQKALEYFDKAIEALKRAEKATSESPQHPQSSTISSINFLKKVDIPNGARPEIVATSDRVFVIYLDIENLQNRSFSLKIFNRDLSREIVSKTLVPTTLEYGSPTDIRVVSDDEYLYAFYETANKDKTYLFGARYILNDNFERVGYTGLIAASKIFNIAEDGDEKLDDPAPVIGPDSVFVVTRIKKSMEKTGQTIYRIREFSFDLKTKLSEFDIDLSSVVDGGARQTSLIYENSFFYIAVPTTVGVSTIPELGLAYPSDIVLVKLNDNWQVVESRIISADPEYNETYVTGFKTDGTYYYLTYNEIKMGVEFRSPLKIYDNDFNLVKTEIVKTMSMKGKRGYGLRPSLEVTDDRIFLGNNEERKAEIYIYEKITSLLDCPKLMPPSPQLQRQCQKEGGQLEPQKNNQGCVVGYKCEKIEEPTSTTDYEDSPFGFLDVPPINFDYYKDLQIKWLEISRENERLGWASVEKIQGQYDFSEHDSSLCKFYKRGLNIIYVTRPINPIYGTSWVEGNLRATDEYPEGRLNDWANFINALVERYDGDDIDDVSCFSKIKIKNYQLVHELGPISMDYWQNHRDEYAEVFETTYNAMKDVCNDCILSMPVPHMNDLNIQDIGFDYHTWSLVKSKHLSEMWKTQGEDYRIRLEYIERIKEIVSKNGFDASNIISLESGMSATLEMECDQAGYVIRSYVSSLAYGQKKQLWTSLIEYTHYNYGNIFAHTGLIHNPQNADGLSHKKLAYYTYKLMVENLEGSDWDNIGTMKESDNVYIYKFSKNGKTIWVAWWDYFNDPNYHQEITKTITLNFNFDGEVLVTESIPDAENGMSLNPEDYPKFFKTQNLRIQNREVVLVLGENPIFIESFSSEVMI